MNQLRYNRLLIFDGSYCLHRNLSQPNLWDMKNSAGKRTGGILGVLKTILKELKEYNYYPIVVFDGGLSKRRLDLYPNYKRNEERQRLLEENKTELDEFELLEEEFRREYNTQRNDLTTLLPLLGIPVIRFKDWEGDDLIYILSKLSKNSIVISDDKDLIQLLYEDNERKCRIKRPIREEFLDLNSLIEKGESVEDFIKCKALIGDPSDNIPSACFQVGAKTALGLVKLIETCKSNNISYPIEEFELDNICKKYNLTKRKAYLNFNESQYLINYNLTKLSLIDSEITDDLIKTILNSIETIILNNINSKDKSLLYQILDYLEIKSFNPQELLTRIDNNLETLNLSESLEEIPEFNKVIKSLFDPNLLNNIKNIQNT